MDEDDFIDFLKLVEVRYNKRILNRLQKKGWLPTVWQLPIRRACRRQAQTGFRAGAKGKETEKEDFTLS